MSQDNAGRLEVLKRGRDCVNSLFEENNDPPQRVSALVQKLRSLCPGGFLYACVLRDAGGLHVSALDSAGSPRTEWARLLEVEWSRNSAAGDDERLDQILGALADHVAGHRLLGAEVRVGGRRLGVLAWAFPESSTIATFDLAQALLASCADHLACRLALEGQARELTEQTSLANCSEVTSSVIHDFNNFLNAALLHIAVLEPDLSATQRGELAEIRAQGADTSRLIKQLQEYCRSHRPKSRKVDLADVLQSVASGLAREASAADGVLSLSTRAFEETVSPGTVRQVTVDVTAVGDLPPILAPAAEIQRLCAFLLRHVVASCEPGQGVRVRLETAAQQVELHFECTKLDSGNSASKRFAIPALDRAADSYDLELAACGSIVRRLKGKLDVPDPSPRGGRVVVTLPISTT